MGDREPSEDTTDARRRFIQRLRGHEAVRDVDFSRNGFQLVLVELEADAEFREEWRQTATRLGYIVEQLEAGTAPQARSENAWVLRPEAEHSADQSGGRATVRHRVARLVQALKERLRE